ncbi:hypothetical protein CPARA_2gp267 (nucleomorph) [Cryptomonas paramecium]|uniref:Uncharacterized protein n=1 Tax=Cryptomonas paramaecium TaxID=2898 RepID=F2HHX9_9CRYP|nr:hypothetical protein CPARA_2gp267 [Cryptomonas paramecium]AEA38925.1 hypothetical protein CPARA_2gp267 [Cryptomonas paramecium]|mmetsp:Transcript_5524/g.17708  ORF Transcript_5524/g.17708 Transcript_5524/m.17708 type:complete len:443 (+) Transcript_5524:8555-9883(+)
MKMLLFKKLIMLPGKIVKIKLDFFIKENSSYNLNSIGKKIHFFQIRSLLKYKKLKKNILETNLKYEIYFIILNKYLNLISIYKIWMFYVKSQHESSFPLVNKAKTGAELLVGFSYFTDKIHFYTPLTPMNFLNNLKFLLNKTEDFWPACKLLFFSFGTFIYHTNYIWIKHNYQKKINLNTYFFQTQKNARNIKEYNPIKKNANFLHFMNFNNNIQIENFNKKKNLFFYKFSEKSQKYNIKNTEVFFFLKKNFSIFLKKIPINNFVLLENFYCDFFLNNLFKIEEHLNFRNSRVFKLIADLDKTTDHLTIFENFIVFIKNITNLRKNLPNIKRTIFFSSEIMFFPFQEEHEFKWNKLVFFLNKKFKRNYFLHSNVVFYLNYLQILIINGIKVKMLLDTACGSVQTTTLCNCLSNVYNNFDKNYLKIIKYVNLSTGSSVLYLNI